MNIEDNERFHVLAHKALAKKATTVEQRELGALIAENPKLKERMEQMGGEASFLRELLPLLDELNHPQRGIPNRLMERLRTEVGVVLDANRKSKGELRELLGKLEDWAQKQTGAGIEEVVALVKLLRGSLLASEGEAPIAADVAISRSTGMGYAAPRLREVVAGRAREEVARQQEEIEKRLVSLEQRLGKAQEITHKCREELQGLLETVARSRAAMAKRHGMKSTTPEQE